MLRSTWMRNLVGAVVAAAALATAEPACAAALGRDYVFIVDCSGTMRYGGRGDATVAALRAIIQRMAPEDCATVYGFGEGAWPILAEYPARVGDEGSKQALMDAITFTFDADRTDITAGVEIAWRERERVLPGPFSPGAEERRDGIVILLTDGKLVPAYDDYAQYDSIHDRSCKRLADLADLFGAAHVSFYTIGLGKASAVDGDLLTAVAAATGGSYHQSPTSAELASVFEDVAQELPEHRVAASDAPAASGPTGDVAASQEVGEPAASVDAGSGGRHAGQEGTLDMVLNVAAKQIDGTYPGIVYQTFTAALGVVMGFVAIGMHRRQSWTNAFIRPLGKVPLRVKGYLRSVNSQGVISARACVPLENPGLECVTIGSGGHFIEEVQHAFIEVVGTPDGSPPLLRVTKGEITINGEGVTGERKLVDGDMLSVEGRTYVYLRGSRR